MTWLEDTEPFELKETVTPKRVAQGLVPRMRKMRDNHIPFSRQYRNWPFVRSKHSKALRKGNGKQEWGFDRDAWGQPHVQGKSSRHMMRLIKQWWQDVRIRDE